MMRRTKRMTMALVPMVLVLGVASLVVAPPASAYVVGFQAVWLHGTGVRVEYPERLSQILYRAYHARIEGKENTSNWLHFPITTPVVGTFFAAPTSGFNSQTAGIAAPGRETLIRRYRLDKVFVSFRSGSIDARVTSVHVYDGPKQIAAFDGLNLYGEQYVKEFVLPGSPEVAQGVCISLGVEFGSAGQRWIELQSVGADFWAGDL